jgi:hypothetical protein
MPTYLDFNTSATFRDYLISKTLQRPDGPQTFTASKYRVETIPVLPNVDPGDVVVNNATFVGEGTSRQLQLEQYGKKNVFKPDDFLIIENINTLPISGNLGLYPYFTEGDHSLISILATENYDNESALFRFAANNIRNEREGPIQARLAQNLSTATLGRARIIDALQGNTATAINLITGREPLIEKNYKITVASTLPGKVIDFVQTVTGVELPFSEIPGDYLSNPANPVQNRREPTTQLGAVLQDVTGALGSMIGISRRPKATRKPSDLFIEHMGNGQKQVLFDNLSYSKYAPNYTTTARSQNSSKLFNFVDRVAQGAKTLLGIEAPRGTAYIGDDRAEDVKYTMSDFNDNMVKSSYYLSLLFDPTQAELFEKQRNVTEGGQLSGKLTWISKNSKNKLGENNQEWAQEATTLNDSLSTKYGFREDSIMGKTQEILDSMPKDGLAARSHVGNVIDQTSRIFKEGDVMLSRGSAIKYIDKYNEESGVEYCRVWTKDRSYYNYSDTMKRTGNIRKFDDSVMSTPWNLNIAPMSNGNKSFDGSTNIFERTQGSGDYYAKKYMFSIENLAWKTSNTPGFTYNDLPFCERGNNGGRVMWFPPYDLKISEQNSARWADNTFIGRPEPIYTYQDTSRTGQLSFKVVVDHPSVLNLLVREHFKSMSDEEAENYINAFFAGCHDLDFYDLIRRYTFLDQDDIKLIQLFLGKGKDPEVIKTYKINSVTTTGEVPPDGDGSDGSGDGLNNNGETISMDVTLKYDNDHPGPRSRSVTSPQPYGDVFTSFYGQKSNHTTGLQSDLTTLLGRPITQQVSNEKTYVFGTETPSLSDIPAQVTKLDGYFEEAKTKFEEYTGKTQTLKEDVESGRVQEISLDVQSSCSSVATELYNEALALRRSHSIIQDFFKRISKDGTTPPSINWVSSITPTQKTQSENDIVIISESTGIQIKKEYKLTDFGYETEGKVIVNSFNFGEKYRGVEGSIESDCLGKEFVIEKGLKINAPIAFYCRQSKVNFKYNKKEDKKDIPDPKITGNTITTIDPDTNIVKPNPTKKPNIDPLKRIIMKTLSECYYFKKLEEDSPVAFKSLKEKLKYFHPAFHSTTPEGLNSRLTFLLQCVRPGDTIPIKGIAEDTDLTARNTSFGPPPVSVLRIGDFYHSKVIVRDVGISYDDSPWDLNPEGIGVQPMIATVTMQIAFIGGQGLAKPIERLQNALSSNFFANTEMYDERSIPTNETIGGQKAEEFTKKFLEELVSLNGKSIDKPLNPNSNTINKDKYLGDGETTLNYDSMVDGVFTTTQGYLDGYTKTYNNVIPTYGEDIGKLLFTNTYRTIHQYDVYTSTSSTAGKTLSLFGEYKKTKELPVLVRGLKSAMVAQLNSTDLSVLFEFDKELTSPKTTKANEYLTPFITTLIEDKLNSLLDTTLLTDLEKSRNELIIALDKVNYIVKYGKDVKIIGEDPTSATLSGFTYDMLYDEYEECITNLEKNIPKFTEDLTSTIDFFNPVIGSTEFERIMKVFVSTEVTNIVELFTQDETLFPERLRKKLQKRLEDFINKPKEKNFKLKKLKNRKTGKKLEYSVSSNAVITDATNVIEANKVHSTNVPVTDKLNFYRKS